MTWYFYFEEGIVGVVILLEGELEFSLVALPNLSILEVHLDGFLGFVLFGVALFVFLYFVALFRFCQ